MLQFDRTTPLPPPISGPRKYAPVGQCIYCGATGYDGERGKLGTEHILPLGLQGELELPEASCRRCERITGRLESVLLRGGLLSVRLRLNLKSRRKSQRPQKLALFSATNNPPHQKFLIDALDYPSYLFLLSLSEPTVIGEYPEGFEPVVVYPWFRLFGVNKPALVRATGGVARVALPSTNVHALLRVLAKIAHAYAVAELGAAAFRHTLPNLISSASISGWHRYIGGWLDLEPPSNHLHELSLHVVEGPTRRLVGVRIRLFSNLGAPTYFVIAGELPEGEFYPRAGVVVPLPSHLDGQLFEGWLVGAEQSPESIVRPMASGEGAVVAEWWRVAFAL